MQVLKYKLPISVFLFVSGILSVVQIKIDPPIILAERFIKGGGWIEILVIAGYGAFLSNKMSDKKYAPRWRMISWGVFSFVFFSQLLMGIVVSDIFLMTGKLHLPIPLMILSGPLYRGELSIMTILFLSTILLSGPAWCSHLCYFGAIDGALAGRGTTHKELKNKTQIKITLLLLIAMATLTLRWLKVNHLVSLITGIIFGAVGILIIFLFSKRQGNMVHCLLYCPIGTIVNYLGKINPFRIKINHNCSYCMDCSAVCRYDALSLNDITRKKPGITCTLCGDCLSVCHFNAIHYRFFNFKADTSREIYLFITVSLHAIFLALAKI